MLDYIMKYSTTNRRSDKMMMCSQSPWWTYTYGWPMRAVRSIKCAVSMRSLLNGPIPRFGCFAHSIIHLHLKTKSRSFIHNLNNIALRWNDKLRYVNTIHTNHTSYAQNTKINHASDATDKEKTKIIKDIIAHNKPSETVFQSQIL